jgi:AmmeMemoRadiSam system protein A
MIIADGTKKALLQLARKTIEEKILGHSELNPDLSDPILKEISGAFVTLHQKGELRGCIGHIYAQSPLLLTIKEMAFASAFQDPRFHPVNKLDYLDLEIEITLLSPLKKATIEEIIPFEHGVVLTNQFKKSTYLPQVWEQIPDKNTFLTSLCHKGGMKAECYLDPDTQIEIYTGIIFNEKDF